MSLVPTEAVTVGMIVSALKMATPLLISAMGELVVQRAGIWNMAVEGTMLTAAFVAYVVVTLTGSPLLALAAAMGAAGVVGLVQAWLVVRLRLDHFVAGLALNLVASGLTLFWFRAYAKAHGNPTFSSLAPFGPGPLSGVPVIGAIVEGLHPLTLVAFALAPLVWAFLEHSRPGLELRCLGENPEALDLRGGRVMRGQTLALVFASLLTGLGGGFLMLAFSDRFLPDFTAGRGWLVVVAIIAGNWRPFRTLIAVLVFAGLDAVAIQGRVAGGILPEPLLLAAPYLVSLAVMVVLRNRSLEPAALGIPWRRH